MAKRTKPSIVSSETAAPAAENPVSDPIDSLSIKQRTFVKALTSPDSSTYGNQTQSYMQAYGTNSYTGTGASATRLVRENANVALAIRSEIERQGLGAEVRVGMIREIIHGRHKAKSRTVSRKADDGSTVVETESTPRAQDTLKALALLDRWDGSEAARSAEASARTSMLQGLTKRLLRTLDTKAHPPAEDARKVPLRASSGNVEHGADGTMVDGTVDDGSSGDA